MDKKTFEQELTELLNRYSKENDSNTPDWILAEYMQDSLAAFNKHVNQRTGWFTHKKLNEKFPEQDGANKASHRDDYEWRKETDNRDDENCSPLGIHNDE